MTTMNQETILRMVAQGKITAEEGAKLLEALDEKREAPRTAPQAIGAPVARPGAGKFLRVIVKASASESTGNQDVDVDVNLPMKMAHRLVPMLDKVIPKDAQEQMSNQGFEMGMLVEMLQSLDEDMEGRDLVNVTVTSDEANGEEVRVRVYVE